MRLFVALAIPVAVRENVAELLNSLRAVATQPRWVRPENLHVTLKFIGEVQKEQLDGIRAALSAAHSNDAVAFRVQGLGFFPNEKRGRVLWVGVEPSENLGTLVGAINQSLEKLGIPLEKRPFSPHLTLARLNSVELSEKLRAAIQANAKREFGSVAAKEFHLIESRLKPSGAEYTTVETFRFVAAED